MSDTSTIWCDAPTEVALAQLAADVGKAFTHSTPLVMVVDDEQGGVIAYATSSEQAERIVAALLDGPEQ